MYWTGTPSPWNVLKTQRQSNRNFRVQNGVKLYRLSSYNSSSPKGQTELEPKPQGTHLTRAMVASHCYGTACNSWPWGRIRSVVLMQFTDAPRKGLSATLNAANAQNPRISNHIILQVKYRWRCKSCFDVIKKPIERKHLTDQAGKIMFSRTLSSPTTHASRI